MLLRSGCICVSVCHQAPNIPPAFSWLPLCILFQLHWCVSSDCPIYPVRQNQSIDRSSSPNPYPNTLPPSYFPLAIVRSPVLSPLPVDRLSSSAYHVLGSPPHVSSSPQVRRRAFAVPRDDRFVCLPPATENSDPVLPPCFFPRPSPWSTRMMIYCVC